MIRLDDLATIFNPKRKPKEPYNRDKSHGDVISTDTTEYCPSLAPAHFLPPLSHATSTVHSKPSLASSLLHRLFLLFTLPLTLSLCLNNTHELSLSPPHVTVDLALVCAVWATAPLHVVTQAVAAHDGPKWHLPSAVLTLGLGGCLEAIAG